jgi:hypothetical protein
MKLYTNRNISLGNGTRPKGFFLGESSAESVEQITQENTTLADGVSKVELRLVLVNLDALTVAGPEMAVPNLVDPAYNPPVPTSGFVDDSNADSNPDGDSESDPGLMVSDEIRAKPVSELKPPKAVAKLLADGGIKTVGELIDYADSHEGLTSLGLTAEQDAEAAAAIEKLLAN